MCVVEKDVWRYPMGDGCELRGDDMPNPFELVKGGPWGGWELPWDRGRGADEVLQVAEDAESERLSWWVFQVGVALWEIQAGHGSPMDMAACMPEARWLNWALCWLMESAPPPPPPWYRFARRHAWRRRQLGALHLLSALTGLYWGLQVQADEQLRLQTSRRKDAKVVWQ